MPPISTKRVVVVFNFFFRSCPVAESKKTFLACHSIGSNMTTSHGYQFQSWSILKFFVKNTIPEISILEKFNVRLIPSTLLFVCELYTFENLHACECSYFLLFFVHKNNYSNNLKPPATRHCSSAYSFFQYITFALRNQVRSLPFTSNVSCFSQRCFFPFSASSVQ